MEYLFEAWKLGLSDLLFLSYMRLKFTVSIIIILKLDSFNLNILFKLGIANKAILASCN